MTPTFSGIMTGLLLLMFIGIWAWSWSSKRKPDFERMANLPLEDEFSSKDSQIADSTDKKDGEAL